VTRFRYGRDPLCVAACGLYAANRWLLSAGLKGVFLRNYFNDALLIPAALPLLLWLERRLGLRSNDARPRWAEIVFTTLIWSFAAEVIAPFLFSHATGDLWDTVAYSAGAVVAALVWRFE
jgi:hypothetical protein